MMQASVLNKKRKAQDIARNASTILATSIGIIVLLSIIIYVFATGFKTLSWKMIVSDYKTELVTVSINKTDTEFVNPQIEGAYFSYNYGIALSDSKTAGGEDGVVISYVDENSPFNKTICIDNTDNLNKELKISKGSFLDVMMAEDENKEFLIAFSYEGAEEYVKVLDQAQAITSLQCTTSGGGIRGSLITTLLLILLTLIISIPLGVGGAIYLVEYAKEGRLKRIIQTMIDMTSGIPSIIFGFCGALIFIPFTSVFGADGYSILAGALTMTIVLLPTIIKTTSEALMVIPSHYTMASLALGASKTQTVFKVIIPNALPGILTAVLLSIGRIIGESAALMFVIGTSISDSVSVLGQSTSLSLHIWSITAGESPNYSAACAISIIILIVVFVMSILVKLISKKINKMAV